MLQIFQFWCCTVRWCSFGAELVEGQRSAPAPVPPSNGTGAASPPAWPSPESGAMPGWLLLRRRDSRQQSWRRLPNLLPVEPFGHNDEDHQADKNDHTALNPIMLAQIHKYSPIGGARMHTGHATDQMTRNRDAWDAWDA